MPKYFFAPLLLLLTPLLLTASSSEVSGVELPPSPDAGIAEADAGQTLLEEEREPALVVPSRLKSPPIESMKPLRLEEDLLARAIADGKGGLVLPGPKGARTPLTIDVALQNRLTSLLREYQVPYGAVVLLEPATGRILAMAEHSETAPHVRGLSTRAVFPAASVFKIITGSALLKAGVSADDSTCYHGGKRRLTERLLMDTQRDGRCESLASAMGKSANVVFAKLTARHLSAEALRQEARLFHFNRPFSFAQPTDLSLAAIPEDPFGLAATGAGFGDVFLSPLHGALIASVAANGGRWQEPQIFAPSVAAPASEERILSPEQAQSLAYMMEQTVTRGTARGLFRQRGLGVPNAVGKTGTLADRRPFRDYSWFVGYAPKEAPRLAVAAVIVNEPRWRIRATFLAREALRLGLARPAPPPLVPLPVTPAESKEQSPPRAP